MSRSSKSLSASKRTRPRPWMVTRLKQLVSLVREAVAEVEEVVDAAVAPFRVSGRRAADRSGELLALHDVDG